MYKNTAIKLNYLKKIMNDALCQIWELFVKFLL